LEKLKRASFNPVMTELSICSHSPDGVASEGNPLLVGGSAKDSIVLARDSPLRPGFHPHFGRFQSLQIEDR